MSASRSPGAKAQSGPWTFATAAALAIATCGVLLHHNAQMSAANDAKRIAEFASGMDTMRAEYKASKDMATQRQRAYVLYLTTARDIEHFAWLVGMGRVVVGTHTARRYATFLRAQASSAQEHPALRVAAQRAHSTVIHAPIHAHRTIPR